MAIPEVVKSTPASNFATTRRPPRRCTHAAKRDPSSYPELKGLAQADSVYHPKNNPSVILGVHTGGGTVSNAAQRVQEAFAPNEMAVAPKDFDLQDPDAKGAVLRCGISKGGGSYIPLCVWADSTSVGDVVGVGDASSSSLKKVDLKTLLSRRATCARPCAAAPCG